MYYTVIYSWTDESYIVIADGDRTQPVFKGKAQVCQHFAAAMNHFAAVHAASMSPGALAGRAESIIRRSEP